MSGDPRARFTRRFGELLEEDYLELLQQVEAYFDQALADAQARSQEKCPDGDGPRVRFESLLIMGTVPAGLSPELDEEAKPGGTSS